LLRPKEICQRLGISYSALRDYVKGVRNSGPNSRWEVGRGRSPGCGEFPHGDDPEASMRVELWVGSPKVGGAQ